MAAVMLEARRDGGAKGAKDKEASKDIRRPLRLGNSRRPAASSVGTTDSSPG
jgi:hypothetical protein